MTIAIQKLTSVQQELSKLNGTDGSKFKNACSRLLVIVKRAFGEDSQYAKDILKHLKDIDNSFLGLGGKDITKVENWITIMIDELEMVDLQPNEGLNNLSQESKNTSQDIEKRNIINNKVFIVHGHNDELLLSAARTVEKLGLIAVILHEQANAGNTIIEKFTKHSDVGFALILLSADDYGYSKKETSKNAKLRARQNVIFELGFFTAHLGRERVVAIYENVPNFELPSDINGVIYIPYNESNGKWQLDLSKELLQAGYNINTNNLIQTER